MICLTMVYETQNSQMKCKCSFPSYQDPYTETILIIALSGLLAQDSY